MLPRAARIGTRLLRWTRRQRPVKIHGPHVTAHVFFYTARNTQGHPPYRWAPILTKDLFRGSVDMHEKRRIVYETIRLCTGALSERQQEGSLLILLRPRATFFSLDQKERAQALTHIITSLPPWHDFSPPDSQPSQGSSASSSSLSTSKGKTSQEQDT